MAECARSDPASYGGKESLADGGPGDADCISVFLASRFHAAGVRCRFAVVESPEGNKSVYLEVFHPLFPKGGQFPPKVEGGFHTDFPRYQSVAVIPCHAWIHDSTEVLSWKRVGELEL